jgi:signal transduction histidine kinase
MPKSSARQLSLKQKLPLLICGLLLGVVVIYSVASYRSVRNEALAIGRERLHTVADQIGDLLAVSATRTDSALRVAARDSAIVRYLQSPATATELPALAVIRRTTPASSQRIVVELWDTQGKLLLSSAPGVAAPHGDVSAEFKRAATAEHHSAIGRLRVERDTTVLPEVAAVIAGGRPIGYYVAWRRIVSTPQARDQLLRLIGPNAALLVGNDTGNVWTDLSKPVAGPPVDVRHATDVAAYTRSAAGPVFGTARAIDGAPWYVVVELGQGAVLGPANQFLRRSAIVGLILVVAGFGIAWRVSREITRPLERLTAASVEIAAGDFSQPLEISRTDELGQLAAAFNTMAAQVQGTQLMLEERVLERTLRLERLQVVMLKTERLNTLAMLGAGLAHDLNNLLFTTSLSVEVLRRESNAGKPVRPELLAQISTATIEAGRLTKRLMSFARIEMDTIEAPTPIELRAAVAAQEDLLRMILPRTVGLSMLLEVSPRRVLVPPTLIEQALVNLVANARDAMPDGGSVTVRVRESNHDTAPRLLVEVTDTGHGISPEIHETIFETFFTTKADTGTGIGLASVRAMMTSVGGDVRVDSQYGAGATFTLVFPVHEESAI